MQNDFTVKNNNEELSGAQKGASHTLMLAENPSQGCHGVIRMPRYQGRL